MSPTDRADMVGFLRRQEMRQLLRAMPVKERNAYISKHREDMDAEMALAICEMPSAFSGVLNGDRTDLINRALEAQHGAKMEELATLEDTISVTESAVDAGADELRIEAGFDSRADFEQAAEQAKPRAYRPWLQKVKENGKEVVRVVRWADATKSSGSLAQPTADELAHGQFFEDRDAYNRANAGVAA